MFNNGNEDLVVIGSVQTEGCLIVYSNNDCIGRSVKIQSPGASNLTRNWRATATSTRALKYLYAIEPKWTWATKSFHMCFQAEGGLELNVDLTDYHPDLKQAVTPKVLKTFKQVCSCHNVPEDIRSIKNWSINNHGNSLMAYYENDCLANEFLPLWIPPGRSSFSIGLGSTQQVHTNSDNTNKILSVGPDMDTNYFKRHCITDNVNDNNAQDSLQCTTPSFPSPREALLLKPIEFMMEEMSNEVSKLQDELKNSEKRLKEMLEQIKNPMKKEDEHKYGQFEIQFNYDG